MVPRRFQEVIALVIFAFCQNAWFVSNFTLPMSIDTSTRLPPRVSAANNRNRSGKQSQSKAARRKMIERENSERERVSEEIASCTDRLIQVLSNGGVDKALLEELQKGLGGTRDVGNAQLEGIVDSLLQADKAVDKSLSCLSCYPSM